MTRYYIPKNEGKLDELYAVLSSDENGEGIVSGIKPDGGHMPFVFGNSKMLNNMKKIVEMMAKDTGKKLLIVKYTKAEILETIG